MLGFLGRWAGSKGMVKVPNLAGLSKQEAINALLAAGLINSSSTEIETSNSSLDGKAYEQSTGSDELVDYETDIQFSYYKYVAAPVAPIASPTAPYAPPTAPYAPPTAPYAPPPTAPISVNGTVYVTYCYGGAPLAESYTVDQDNVLVQNINQACGVYSTLLTNIGATNVSCSTSSMPSVPTCSSSPTAAPTAPSPTVLDCQACVGYNSLPPTSEYACADGCGNYTVCNTANGCPNYTLVPCQGCTPTAPAPTSSSITWYCTTSVQCAGTGNCSYSTSSSNQSASGSGYSTSCNTRDYTSCGSTNCTGVPTAPVSSPTAPAPTGCTCNYVNMGTYLYAPECCAPDCCPNIPVSTPVAPSPTAPAPTASPEASPINLSPEAMAPFDIAPFDTSANGNKGSLLGTTLVKSLSGFVTASTLSVGDELVSVVLPNLPESGWTKEDIQAWNLSASELSYTNNDLVATRIVSINTYQSDSVVIINRDIFSARHAILINRDGMAQFINTTDVLDSDLIWSTSEADWVAITSLSAVNVPHEVISINCEPYDLFFTESMLVHDTNLDAPSL